MKSSKKLVIAVSSLILTFAISIVAVVAIFAAQNQSVQSSLTIRYTAVDVSASVRANYIIGNTTTAMLTDDGEEELVFLPASVEGGSLTPQDEDIELNTQNDFIVFEYIFTNNSSTIDVAIDLDTTAFSVNNMTVEYAYSYEKIENTMAMPTTNSFEPMMILGEEKENGYYETLYVYVKVKISNLANDAYFEGNMDFSLARSTPVELTFENIEGATNSVLLQPRKVPANTAIKSLPSPTFADGEKYTWFNESTLETVVITPLILSEDLTVYAGVATYMVTASDDGSVIIENYLDEAIFVDAPSALTFSFGVSEKSKISGYEYLVVNPNQKLTVFEISEIEEVSVSTEEPVDLEERSFFSAYGAYPQSYVGDTYNEFLKSTTLAATGNSYSTNVDGDLIVLEEYSYEEYRIAKLDGVSKVSGSDVFSTGEYIKNGQTYFFVVEPIVARAMEKNVDGTYTMFVPEILGSTAFNGWEAEEENGIFDNSWQNSEVRLLLNSLFLNESGLNDVAVEQSITNTDYFGTSPVSENTIDKIWMPSVEDVLNWSLSSEYLDEFINTGVVMDDEYMSIRKMGVSDMSRATYAGYVSEEFNAGIYWLRTPGGFEYIACFVYFNGAIAAALNEDGYKTYYSEKVVGICPVFAVYV